MDNKRHDEKVTINEPVSVDYKSIYSTDIDEVAEYKRKQGRTTSVEQETSSRNAQSKKNNKTSKPANPSDKKEKTGGKIASIIVVVLLISKIGSFAYNDILKPKGIIGNDSFIGAIFDDEEGYNEISEGDVYEIDSREPIKTQEYVVEGYKAKENNSNEMELKLNQKPTYFLINDNDNLGTIFFGDEMYVTRYGESFEGLDKKPKKVIMTYYENNEVSKDAKGIIQSEFVY
ncbi:MAG: hypothetical protein RR543_01415 [Erysipelotrichales bacterium]